jgi:hypothetical protein
MNKVLELYTYLRKKGAVETLNRIKSRYFSTRKFILYRRDLSQPFEGIELGPEYSVSYDDFHLLHSIRERTPGLPREFYVDKTHGGKHFYMVTKDGDAAHIVWIFLKSDYSRFFTLKSTDVAELNYIATAPKHKGCNLMARTINRVCRDLGKQGYSVLVQATSFGNYNSHMSLKRTGFYVLKEVQSRFSFVKKTVI